MPTPSARRCARPCPAQGELRATVRASPGGAAASRVSRLAACWTTASFRACRASCRWRDVRMAHRMKGSVSGRNSRAHDGGPYMHRSLLPAWASAVLAACGRVASTETSDATPVNDVVIQADTSKDSVEIDTLVADDVSDGGVDSRTGDSTVDASIDVDPAETLGDVDADGPRDACPVDVVFDWPCCPAAGLACDGPLPPDGACSAKYGICHGACVDIYEDPENCGGCGVKCIGVCNHGVCTCGGVFCFCDVCPIPGGFACRDFDVDPHNCGKCGNECPATAPCCVHGVCARLDAGSSYCLCDSGSFCP